MIKVILLGFFIFLANSLRSQEIKQKSTSKDNYFSIVGKSKKDNYGEPYYEANQINILSKKNNEIVQTISLSNLNLKFYTIGNYQLQLDKLLRIDDLNFDGKDDIMLQESEDSHNYPTYIIFLYSTLTSAYKRNISFERASSFITINKSNQELFYNSSLNNGTYINAIFKVTNNRIVLQNATETVFANDVRLTNGKDNLITYNYYEKNENGTLQKLKSYSILDTVSSFVSEVSKIAGFKYADDILKYFGSETIIQTQSEITEFNIPEGYVYTIYTSREKLSDKLVVFVSKDNEIIEINADATTTFWKFPYGLKYGMTVNDLVKLNGKPINITGFETDHGGEVIWNGGKLQSKNISVEMDYKGKMPDEFIGDNAKIISDDPKLKSIVMHVKKITVHPY